MADIVDGSLLAQYPRCIEEPEKCLISFLVGSTGGTQGEA